MSRKFLIDLVLPSVWLLFFIASSKTAANKNHKGKYREPAMKQLAPGSVPINMRAKNRSNVFTRQLN